MSFSVTTEVDSAENISGSFISNDFGLNQDGNASLELMTIGGGTYDVRIEVSNSRKNWINIDGIEKFMISSGSAPHGWEIPTNFTFMRVVLENIVGTIDALNIYLGVKP